MKRMTRALSILVAAVAFAALAISTATAAPQAKKATHYKASKFVLQARLIIKSDDEHGKKGPDGKWHDAYLPANFTVLAGVPVKVTVINYDEGKHSFTSSALHVNKLIPAAKNGVPGKITFTFKANKAGKYLWWCNQPCDPWAMAHIGYMRGYVNVVA